MSKVWGYHESETLTTRRSLQIIFLSVWKLKSCAWSRFKVVTQPWSLTASLGRISMFRRRNSLSGGMVATKNGH